MPGNPILCAVVVTFHPPEEVFGNLRAIAAECGRVLVVDNGSAPEVCARLAAVPGVVLLALGENLGVATALNRGALWARGHGCGWMITFDQDSAPAPGLAAGLWAAHERHPQAAVIGPRIAEEGMKDSTYRWVRRHPRVPGFFQRVACGDTDLPAVTLLVSSGSLIDLGVWAELGGFDEALFIDYVDSDFCLRALRSGRSLAVAAAARLRHRLGARQTGRLLGRDLRPMHHEALRHYYLARNRVRVWRRHALAVPHWALFDLAFAGLNGFRVVVFEEAKWAKLKATLLGTLDGLKDRTGACPENRRRALQS
jgi:rhamnosyltransferase